MMPLDPQRARLLATAIAVAPAAVAVAWLTARSPALTDKEATLGEAARAGHRLAAAILALALLSTLAVRAAPWLERRIHRQRSPLVFAGIAGGLAVGVALFAALELPGHLGDRPAYWRVAWSEFEHHAWLGSGAGTFGQFWRQTHPLGLGALDAHNLYLETLAELGPFGLALLAAALAVPLVPAVRLRATRLAPAAAGAYVSYLVHAGFDWDWELPAVTIAGLFCAGALLSVARDAESSSPLRVPLLVAVLALAALALAGEIANVGLGS